MAQVTNDTDDDDDFGDFSAAEKPCLNGHHTPEDGQGVISKEDDFEDFPASSENDAAAALDTQTSPPQQQSPDEDVGDFESESASASDDKLDVDVPIHQSPETNFDGNADPIENSTQDTGDTATPNATVANTVEAGSSSVDDYEAAKEENGSVEEAERDTALEATGPASPDGLVTKPAEASDSSENPNIGNIVAADETETTIKITPVEEDNGEFGDFNAPSSETGAQKIEESFGDFNDGPSNNNDGGAEPAAAEAPSTTTTDANGLGNFNESPSTAIESKTTEESLGAFNEPVSNADAGAAAAPIPLTTKDDEDFGDFGDFNVPETDTSAPIESKATEESFGDFNELMPSNVNGTATTTGDNGHGDSSDFNGPASETDVSGDPIETKATEESFGDFNAPSISDTKADDGAAQTTTSGDDDDDFGGFGDFNGPSSEPDHKGTSIESKPTEDSFGDFNEPSSKPSEAEAPATTTTSDDDEEFGDFGDFDSGENSQPPRKDQGNDNDFGSFSGGKAEAASSGFAATFEAQARPASSKEEIDPMLQKAKTVLSKVFEGFKIEGLDEKANASEKIAVAELTASMDSDYDSKNRETLVLQFQAILDEMRKDEPPPMFIVAGGERFSPNSHFSVPIDGESAGRSGRPQESDPGMSPEPQTPSGTSSSHDQTTRGHSAQPTQTATMVQLPPESSSSKPPSGAAEESLSQKAQQLLLKIPDLAFMLQSSLRLPSSAK